MVFPVGSGALLAIAACFKDSVERLFYIVVFRIRITKLSETYLRSGQLKLDWDS